VLLRPSFKARKKRLFGYFDYTGRRLELFTVICHLSLWPSIAWCVEKLGML
jgi:hypothetical protein